MNRVVFILVLLTIGVLLALAQIPVTGSLRGWSSNGVCYIRFANNNLVTAQDPANGTFKIRADKFQ